MTTTLRHALPVALALLGAAHVLTFGQRDAQSLAGMVDGDTATFHLVRSDGAYRVSGAADAVPPLRSRATSRLAYAEFLLDEGRAAEVTVLLDGREDVEALLLQALALRWQGDAQALAPVRVALQARFDAAARRGDIGHLREQARFTLHVLGNSRAALALAQRNWQVRKEWTDARILLEAAIAAQDSAALLPVLRWMDAQAPQVPAATAS